MDKNLRKKIDYYALDLPYCLKSALLNTFRIMAVLLVLGFLILILQGETVEDVLAIVYDSITHGLVRVFIALFLLITCLRFYSKYVFWNKTNVKEYEAIELHNQWINQ